MERGFTLQANRWRFSAKPLVSAPEDLHFYGCLQSLMKFHPLFDLAIAKIIVHDPLAIVVMLRNKSIYSWQRIFEQRLLRHITGTYPDGLLIQRIILIDQMSDEDYMTVLCSMSVNLDPFPFGGGVTLTDSLQCGVPYVTIPSMQSVHKLGAGIAHHLKFGHFIAQTLDEYVAKAIRFAEQPRMNITTPDLNSFHVDVVIEWRAFLKRVTG